MNYSWNGRSRPSQRSPTDEEIERAIGLIHSPTQAGAHLISRCAADIVPRRIDFLWPGRIACGKHTAIAGEPGDGKSQLSVYVAATISQGGEWPCREGRAPVGNVIILNAEDGADDTVVPRLIVAGADLRRVHIVSAVLQQDGKGCRTFNLQADLALLEHKIAEIGDVALLIIDPISSYLGKTDSHKNAEVRGTLEPLSEMAARLNVAILSITHFSKSGAGSNTRALHRFIGSIAFVGAPRAAFAVIEDADNEGRVLLLHAKNNMARKPQGLAYRLVQDWVDEPGKPQNILASYIAWDHEPVALSADDALRATEEGSNKTAKTEAMEFLQGALADGPMPAAEVSRMAREHGLTTKVVRSARESLKIKIERDGFGPGSKSLWSLPRGSILAQTAHRCPSQAWASMGGRGQVCSPAYGPPVPEAVSNQTPKADPPTEIESAQPAPSTRASNGTVALLKEDRACAQCGGRVDGKERLAAIGGRTVWLHTECERFYQTVVREAAPAHDMPASLRRCLRCNRPGTADRGEVTEGYHSACRLDVEATCALSGGG